MIDISQIVSSAANAFESARRATSDPAASGFGDALSRARESNKAATPVPKETAAREQPAARPAAPHVDAGKPRQADATGKKSASGQKEQDQDQEDTAAAPTDAAAAAAAAMALMLPAAATPAPAPAQASAAGIAVAGTGGVGDTAGTAALQAALASAAQPATTDAQAEATATAAATLPPTLQAATTNTGPARPSVADTLATIASQRATMQAGASTSTDGKAGATQAVPGDMLAAGRDAGASARASGDRADRGIGQHRADPLASAGTPDARPAAMPFAAAQAAVRTGEQAAAGPDHNEAVIATLAGQPTPSAAAAAASAASPPVIAPPLYDSQWPQALGQQMIRLGTQGQQSAELQLNPPDLGPLKVVLNVVNDQAQAQFVSPHQAVRAAVEAALPHLRTALSENGIQLGQTSVGADGFAGQAGNGQQQQAPGQGRGQAGLGGAAVAATEPVPAAGAAARPARVLGRGEIDTFA